MFVFVVVSVATVLVSYRCCSDSVWKCLAIRSLLLFCSAMALSFDVASSSLFVFSVRFKRRRYGSSMDDVVSVRL